MNTIEICVLLSGAILSTFVSLFVMLSYLFVNNKPKYAFGLMIFTFLWSALMWGEFLYYILKIKR